MMNYHPWMVPVKYSIENCGRTQTLPGTPFRFTVFGHYLWKDWSGKRGSGKLAFCQGPIGFQSPDFPDIFVARFLSLIKVISEQQIYPGIRSIAPR